LEAERIMGFVHDPSPRVGLCAALKHTYWSALCV
jgi:hypothetical protein